MNETRKIIVAAALALFLAMPAWAEDGCSDDQTWLQCYMAKYDESVKAVEPTVAKAKESTEKAMKAAPKKNQKTPTADQSPGAASAVRDFLPTFFTSLGLGTVAQSDEAITLTFNPEFLRLEHQQWSLEARILQPEPLEKLVMEAAEGDRQSAKEGISAQLGDYDDVEVSATFTYRNSEYGRDFKFHTDLLESLLDEAVGELPSLQKLADSLEDARTGLAAQFGGDPLAKTFGELRSEDPVMADALESNIMAAIEELVGDRKSTLETLSETNYFEFANLVNNQPQITASLKVRERDDLIGQDMVTGNISYELGLVNVNRFRGWCDRKGKDRDLTCLKEYWDSKGANFDHLPRFKFSLDYESIKDLETSFEALSLTLPSSEKLVGSASFGSFLTLDDEGDQTSRFDIEAKYEYVNDEETRNRRYVLTGTYSQRLSDLVSATLGVVYASDPEFRGEVDKALSARAGLKFKVNRKAETSGS